MNIRSVFPLVAFLFLGISAAAAQMPTDAEAKKRLVGTWTIKIERGTITLTGEQQLRPDGTFSATADLSMPDQKEHHTWEGTWNVEASALVTKVTSSSDPEHPKVGKRSEDMIVEITDRTYKTRDEKGRTEEYTRK